MVVDGSGMDLLGKEYLTLEHKACKVLRVHKVLRVVKVLRVLIQM
jgi:hypothetical protein